MANPSPLFPTLQTRISRTSTLSCPYSCIAHRNISCRIFRNHSTPQLSSGLRKLHGNEIICILSKMGKLDFLNFSPPQRI